MRYSPSEVRLILLACCVGGFVTPLLSTMMSLSLINIGDEFSVGSHDLGYVNTAFLLASAVGLVPAARLGDLIGKKKVYMIGMALIGTVCLLAPFSPNFWVLILCRALIGIGSAATTCMSMSLVVDVCPPERRGGAIGIQTMCIYIGLAIGPVIGGFVNDLAGWHALFFLVVPMAFASLALMMMFKHEIAPAMGGSMDGKGTILYSLAILLSMGGVVNLPETWAIVCLVLGVVFLVAFFRQQASISQRLLNVHLFRNRAFTASCLASFMSYAASFSLSFFLPLYLCSIGMLTATEAGFLMLIQPAIQAVCTPMFGRFSDRVSDKRLLPSIGIAIAAVGELTVVFYTEQYSLPLVALTMVLVGFGMSMFSAPNTSVIMSSVPPAETGDASAMVSVMRQTGMMVSMGVAMLMISLIMGSADDLNPSTYGAFIDVLQYSFVIAFLMCCVGAVFSLMRGKGQKA